MKTKKVTATSKGKKRTPMSKAILVNLEQWIDKMEEPARDKPIVGTAGGEQITPRILVNHVRRATPTGRQYVNSFERLALNHVMSKALR